MYDEAGESQRPEVIFLMFLLTIRWPWEDHITYLSSKFEKWENWYLPHKMGVAFNKRRYIKHLAEAQHKAKTKENYFPRFFSKIFLSLIWEDFSIEKYNCLVLFRTNNWIKKIKQQPTYLMWWLLLLKLGWPYCLYLVIVMFLWILFVFVFLFFR